jgi:aspartyl-tRNA(Asn)/glutamyl-tRNA(Gln) amidotransferase subunit A
MSDEDRDPTDSETLREVTRELPFALSDVDTEQYFSTIGELESAAETLYGSYRYEVPEDVAIQKANDEFGSLLYVYDDPEPTVDTGILSGLHVGVKDNLAVAGLPMTCGSENLHFTPEYDAVVVERLCAEGSVVVGKTNQDAFAFGPSGEFSEVKNVVNPTAPDRVPGGSSSGSGAAVAAGLLDATLGTDTGGSVRIPAACCGIVGAKPTHGLVPRHGLASFAPSLDTIGPLARDVQTAADVLETIAGYDVRDPSSHHLPPRPLSDLSIEQDEKITVGIGQPFVERSTDEVSSAFTNAVSDLESEAALDVSPVDIDLGRIEEAYYLIGATEFVWWLRQDGIIRGQGTDYEEQWRSALVKTLTNETLGPHIAGRVLPSAYLDHTTRGKAYTAARQEAIEFTRRLNRLFERIDLLVTPTIRSLPPEPGQISASERLNDLLGNTAPFNLSGMPAVSVPLADHEGLPISVQVVAPRFEDRVALIGAQIIEDAVQK